VKSRLTLLPFLITVLLALPPLPDELWQFDRLDSIGGHPATAEGHPRVISTPDGKAVEFDGQAAALFIESHPLAGAAAFTWEVLFRPDLGGAAEQRFFHLQERDPKTGADTATRMLFEIRVVGEQWALDSYATTGPNGKALMDRAKLHPLGQWHAVEAVYDGKEFRNYVDGVLEGAAPLEMGPQGAGHTSVGVRINRRDYFKGAVLRARMTRRALAPNEFLKVPESLRAK
jgi:hypothetical protein